MRLRRTALLCAACLVLLTRPMATAQDKEPTYGGKTVSQWTERLKDKDAAVVKVTPPNKDKTPPNKDKTTPPINNDKDWMPAKDKR